MRYQVLGPVALSPRTPTAAKVRVLLATFLIRADQVVSSQALIDEIWGDEPPRTVTTTLQVYVSQLRTLLAEGTDNRRDRDGLLQTQPPGYRLRVGPDELDLARFERLRDSGRRAYERGAYEETGARLREALGLWTGAALSGVPHGPLLSAAAVHLEESRLAVLEQRVAADLRLGRHAGLIAELLALAAEHPYREVLHAHLMVALYRSERQSDALLAFRNIRRALVDELGVEPGPALARLHARVLRSDPALLWPQDAPKTQVRTAAPVSLLPPAVPDLIGRDRLLTLAAGLAEGDGEHGAARLLVVSGAAGVGKTAFAVELARQQAEAFPDGQLLVPLRDPRGAALDPAAAAAAVLRLVGPGTPLPGLPADVDRELASALRGRRLLVVLDDAVSEAQVRPVAEGLDRGLLVVTGRRSLVGLENARLLTLEPLTAAESQRLLLAVAGARVNGDPAAVREIASLCGGLPLALRVAGAALNARPHWTPTTLAGRLADRTAALDLLSAGDLEVRAALAVGYDELGVEEQRAFRLLSITPEAGFSLWGAAVLLRTTPAKAERLLELLVEVRLLEILGTGRPVGHRYGYHRLLRALAQEKLHGAESPELRRAAADRLGRAYLALARHADRSLAPGRPRPPSADRADSAGQGDRADGADRAGRAEGPEGPPLRLDWAGIVGSSPVGWFQAEIQGLLEAVRHASEARDWSLVLELTDAVSGYLDACGRWDEWAVLLDLALEAAVLGGSDRGRANVLRMLGDLAWQQRRTRSATDHYTDAGRLFEELDDVSGALRCLIGAGDAALSEGDPTRAEECYQAVLRRDADGLDRRAGVDARRGLALVLLARGRAEDALQRFQEFTDAAEAIGDQRWARFGQRSVERVLEHMVDWSSSQHSSPPAAVEARPGIWLVQLTAGAAA